MIGFTFDSSSNEERLLDEKEFARMRAQVARVILKAQLLFETEVKKTLTGKRSGRIYVLPSFARRRAGGKRTVRKTYQASAPGEPPALATGTLRLSITHGPVMWEGNTASGSVGTNAVQARILEFGGVTGAGHRTRILPRPYFAPTFLRITPQLEAILAEAVKSLMWDRMMAEVMTELLADETLVSIFGTSIRQIPSSGEMMVPGLEWSLVGDVETEVWEPMIVQFDVWTEDPTDTRNAERRLRQLYHSNVQRTIGPFVVLTTYLEGTVLAVPDRANFTGRAIRFTMAPLREQYAGV